MNNLRVDVILESEIRSSSPVSLKFVGRIVGITVLVAVVALVALFFGKAKLDRNKLKELTDETAKLLPRQQRVWEYRHERNSNTAVRAEIEGWNRSREPSWHQILTDLQANVPTNMQITTLQSSDEYLAPGPGEKTYSRKITLSLQGRTELPDPKGTVDNFLIALVKGPGFSNMVESADKPPPTVVTVPGEDLKNHRVFTIPAIKYKPRPFK